MKKSIGFLLSALVSQSIYCMQNPNPAHKVKIIRCNICHGIIALASSNAARIAYHSTCMQRLQFCQHVRNNPVRTQNPLELAEKNK